MHIIEKLKRQEGLKDELRMWRAVLIMLVVTLLGCTAVIAGVRGLGMSYWQSMLIGTVGGIAVVLVVVYPTRWLIEFFGRGP